MTVYIVLQPWDYTTATIHLVTTDKAAADNLAKELRLEAKRERDFNTTILVEEHQVE